MKYLNLKTSCFLSAICLLFSISTALAQQTNGKIKGTITTSEGDPAAGVNVVLKNSKYGTVTNDDGTFELNRVNQIRILCKSL